MPPDRLVPAMAYPNVGTWSNQTFTWPIAMLELMLLPASRNILLGLIGREALDANAGHPYDAMRIWCNSVEIFQARWVWFICLLAAFSRCWRNRLLGTFSKKWGQFMKFPSTLSKYVIYLFTGYGLLRCDVIAFWYILKYFSKMGPISHARDPRPQESIFWEARVRHGIG